MISFLLAGTVFLFHLFSVDRRPGSINPQYFFYLSPEASPSVAPVPSLMESLPGAAQLALGRKIDLNRASQEDLEALPGIGPRLAEKILEDRKRRGPYKKIDELMRVKGIKEKKLAKLRPYLSVEEGEKRGQEGKN